MKMTATEKAMLLEFLNGLGKRLLEVNYDNKR